MNGKEQEQKKSRWNNRTKLGLVIAGVGLLAEVAPVVIIGGGLALSGVIFERGKAKQQVKAA